MVIGLVGKSTFAAGAAVGAAPAAAGFVAAGAAVVGVTAAGAEVEAGAAAFVGVAGAGDDVHPASKIIDNRIAVESQSRDLSIRPFLQIGLVSDLLGSHQFAVFIDRMEIRLPRMEEVKGVCSREGIILEDNQDPSSGL